MARLSYIVLTDDNSICKELQNRTLQSTDATTALLLTWVYGFSWSSEEERHI